MSSRLGFSGREWRILLAVGLPLVVGSVNLFGVTLALADIHAEFGLGFEHLRWVIVAFIVPDIVFLLVAGRYGDFIGRRRVLVTGAAIFAVGASLSALVPVYGALIVARNVEGVGAGLMFGGLLAIIADSFPPEGLGTAFGVWGMIGAIAFGASPLLAGALVHGAGWRWLFALNALTAMLTAVLGLRLLEDDTHSERPVGDPAGLVVVGIGLTCATTGLMQGMAWGWTSFGVLSLLVVGTGLLVLGAFVERRVANPFFPAAVLASLNFAAGTSIVAVVYMVQELMILVVVLDLALVRSWTALEAGLVLLAYSVMWLLLAGVSGRLADRVGARTPIVVGSVLAAAGSFVLAGSAPSIAALCVGLGILGIGVSLCIPPANAAAMRHVPAGYRGEASGVNMTMRLAGSLVGIVAGGSVVLARHHAILGMEVARRGGDPRLLDPANLGGLLDAAAPLPAATIELFGGLEEIVAISGSAFEHAVATTLVLCGALFAGVFLIAVFGIRGERHRISGGPTAG